MRTIYWACLAVALLFPGIASAQTASSGTNALPGVIRTAAATEFASGFQAGVLAGYGFRGDTFDINDRHHRGSARLSLSYAISSKLAASLSFDGRYDKHQSDEGGDDGWIGSPALQLRYRDALSKVMTAGVQVRVWAPGSEAPSVVPSAASATFLALWSWQASPALVLSANAGYRIDRSAAIFSTPDRLSMADRLGAGISESNAVVAALGLSYSLKHVELLGELGLDYLHQDDQPFRSSPMRIALGARKALNPTMELLGYAELSVSDVGRFKMDPGLFVVEPLVQVMTAFHYRFGVKAEPERIIVEDVEPIKDVEPILVKVALTGTLQSRGEIIAGADITVTDSEGTATTAVSGEDGGFTVPEILVGKVVIEISAPGFDLIKRTLTLSETSDAQQIDLVPTLPPGQLRGVVQSFGSSLLQATLTISPGNKTVTAGANGTFRIDLPPGKYEVTITADGYKTQTQSIKIEESGVTILNVDLYK